MSIPKFNNLLQTLDDILKNFDPTTLMYLNIKGNWVRNPQTLRDRISNELWFRIWEARQNENYVDRIKGIIQPFIRDKNSWDITIRIYKGISDLEEETNGLFIISEMVYLLIEYSVNKRNSEIYVADWDYKSKIERERYSVKVRKFKKKTQQVLDDDAKINTLSKIVDQLKGEREDTFNNKIKVLEDIFNIVSLIIAEEEKVREWICDMLAEIRDTKKKNEIYEIIGEHIDPEIKTITNVPQALLRPCLELLSNPDIDVSSGLQFKSSSILGILNDLRSADVLLGTLETCDLKYTNIRCNLIYALGNLKQKKALKHFIHVLEEPDVVEVYLGNDTQKYLQPLQWEKCEAIWAIGKLGGEAVEAIPALMKFINNPDREINISLAWAMGMIGKEQKEKYGGIDSGAVITLMNLLTAKNSKIFEEVAFSLKKLALPDFLHSLYLHNIETIPILALKPSSIGLYELSETIFHLMSVKKPVVMAVTGDSGTGKTYFCEVIKEGFGGIKENEVLYLMRDNPGHLYLFNRMLGLKLLKEHVDPQYYQDYPLTEDTDNPDEFFNNFIKKYSNKKLIILDGWMDRAYFYQAIRAFYEKGYLDVIVNFRTTYSTKRFNLEEREGLLENVKTCLTYIEEPMIEDTEFYRNGDVLVYNLDNSILSRLNNEEIFEIFGRKKVDTWGDYIRIGKFKKNLKPLRIEEEKLSARLENICSETQHFTLGDTSQFSPSEVSFSRILNEKIEQEPNFLQTIKTSNLKINRIAFYTHGQIAYCGHDGSVGILFGLNDRIFYVNTHQKRVAGLGVVGEDIYSIDVDGKLKITSFHENKITNIDQNDAPACSIAAVHTGQVVTGHFDGTIKKWDIQSKEVKIIKGHRGAVLVLVIDRYGRILSSGEDKELRIWSIRDNKVKIFNTRSPISAIGLYPDGRVVVGSGSNKECVRIDQGQLAVVNVENNICKSLYLSHKAVVDMIHVYLDGRIIAGINIKAGRESVSNVVILDPRSDFRQYKILGAHGTQISDCITIGPRIITCGTESNSEHTLRIWGTEFYVKMEHDKLKLMTESMHKPSYYRNLF